MFTQQKLVLYPSVSLCKICDNVGFLVPIFSCIRTKSTILALYRNIQVRENPYSGIFYAVYYKIIIAKLFTRYTTLMINHEKIYIGSWRNVMTLVYYMVEPLTGQLVSIPFLFVLFQIMVLFIKFHIQCEKLLGPSLEMCSVRNVFKVVFPVYISHQNILYALWYLALNFNSCEYS